MRIRRDFGLLPGLALTLPQARRLWALQDAECRALLDALVADGFLRVRPDARYVMREPARLECRAKHCSGCRTNAAPNPAPHARMQG